MQVTDIPYNLADYWGVADEVAMTILSITVMLMVILPAIILDREGKHVFATVILAFLTSLFLAGVGWMPFWVLIIEVLVVAILWSGIATSFITGGE